MTVALDEYNKVELPLIEQLEKLGWGHLEGDVDVPYLTERDSFREVLLKDRLKEAIRKINLDDNGQPWLDDRRINQAIGDLERLGARKLMEANKLATELLIKGTTVEGDPDKHSGREQTVRFIDFENPDRNDFLVINQFRVDPPWAVGDKDFIIPDTVLFINGIPLIVIECKSPNTTNPLEEGITQLLRYSNQRDWVEEDEGAERLFHYNQIMVSTYWYDARAAGIGASYDHFIAWKDTSPVPTAEVAEELGVEQLSSQQTLVAGMLRKEHLLDIVRNFIVFKQDAGKTTKIVTRYQQFRAVQEAIRRLQTGQTRAQHGESDQRGGIIWHTQGSGKSLTMVFLIRKMRTLPDLRRFKVVVITDRIDLEKQLEETAALTGETVRKPENSAKLQSILRETGSDLVFGMIQKYLVRDEETTTIELQRQPEMDFEVSDEKGILRKLKEGVKRLIVSEERFPVLNESEEILVFVDEAHRSQDRTLHANLMRALPNCAKIGFTGTPIILSKHKKRTHDIFGEYIDTYTIQQSELDGVTVKILYEGRLAEAEVSEGLDLDQLFEEIFAARTPKELEAIKAKYVTEVRVLEAKELIQAKATDMLRHYVANVIPNGFKAQVVAASRLAAVRYLDAFQQAQAELLVELDKIDQSLLDLPEEEIESLDEEAQLLVRAKVHEDTLRRLEFGVVISGRHNDDPAWKEFSDKTKQDVNITRFKKPLKHEDPEKQDGLAFLIVQRMLLTGFDAPYEQVLYLDRFTQGHELLQTIARVNRTSPRKTHGLVVDYYGVGRHLKEALAIYSEEDIEGALISIKDELPKLKDRHQRVISVFQDKGIKSIEEVDACVDLLRDTRIRADFVVKLKKFLESMDIILPRQEALPFLRDMKILGFINQAARNLYRDSRLNLIGCSDKVRQLIDKYIIASGIDPKIPPISIMEAEFEKAVEGRVSDRAKASEMEHAARHYIRKHFHEDPVYYKKLSERLEEILASLEGNWAELVPALRRFTEEVRAGRPADKTDLDPRTQAPFLGIILEEGYGGEVPSHEILQRLVQAIVEIVEHIRQEIRMVDFWSKVHARNVLRGWLVKYLDDNDTVPFERVEITADRLVELAKNLHSKLTV
jgi:type I restriction enzyme R subunit